MATVRVLQGLRLPKVIVNQILDFWLKDPFLFPIAAGNSVLKEMFRVREH